MLVGSLASVFTAVGLDWAQQLQGGAAVAAEDPAPVALFDLHGRFVPFESHTWSILDFTFELGLSADVYVQGLDLLPKDRGH